jgi:hypothetical protein
MTMKGAAILRKNIIGAVFGVILVLAFCVGVSAAPSVLGTSGNIITPDDTIVPAGGFNLGYHGVANYGSSSDTVNFFAGNVGLFPNVEVGVGIASDGDTNVLVNAKYRLLTESSTRPAVTVGVIDAGAQFTDDVGPYILISKDLTTKVEEIGGRPSTPLRGHLGLGGGAVKTLFGALDWTVNPKLRLMVEFISDSELRRARGETLFNAGLRYAITSDVRLDVGTIDFQDLMFGISYQATRF